MSFGWNCALRLGFCFAAVDWGECNATSKVFEKLGDFGDLGAVWIGEGQV